MMDFVDGLSSREDTNNFSSAETFEDMAPAEENVGLSSLGEGGAEKRSDLDRDLRQIGQRGLTHLRAFRMQDLQKM